MSDKSAEPGLLPVDHRSDCTGPDEYTERHGPWVIVQCRNCDGGGGGHVHADVVLGDQEPSAEPVEAWRLEVWAWEYGRLAPLKRAGAAHVLLEDNPLTARCVKDPRHEPPVTGCSCGVYATRTPQALADFCAGLEYLRQAGGDDTPASVAVLKGRLSDAMPPRAWVPPQPGCRPGEVGVHVDAHGRPTAIELPSDPVGTIRGSAFDVTQAWVVGQGDEAELSEWAGFPVRLHLGHVWPWLKAGAPEPGPDPDAEMPVYRFKSAGTVLGLPSNPLAGWLR